MRPKGSAAELEQQRRRLAVALLEQGMKPANVAKAVGTSRVSVTRWRQAYQKGGGEAMSSKPHPGKTPRLTVAQRGRLAKLLLQSPRKHGYNSDLWTLARVAEAIAVNFGVQYHPGHVWYVLRSMRWSSRKPECRARERDEQAIEQWRQQEWPRIENRPRKRAKRRIPG